MYEVWYHGTMEEVAEAIMEDGFKPGSHFAKHLEDALVFGGPFVFAVYFPKSPAKGWQFVCDSAVSPERIAWLRHFDVKTRYINKDLRVQMARETHAEQYPDREFCKNCDGRGQLEIYDGWVKDRGRTMTPCPKCNGHGVLNYWQRCMYCENQLGPKQGAICNGCKQVRPRKKKQVYETKGSSRNPVPPPDKPTPILQTKPMQPLKTR